MSPVNGYTSNSGNAVLNLVMLLRP